MPIKPENKSKYPKNWLEIRQRILARAGNKCEWCGVPNYAVGTRNVIGGFQPICGNTYRDSAGRGELSYADAKEIVDYENEMNDGGPKTIMVVLTTAHVHDHRPENCEESNLAALCQACHNRHDQKHRAENRRNVAGQMMLVPPEQR